MLTSSVVCFKYTLRSHDNSKGDRNIECADVLDMCETRTFTDSVEEACLLMCSGEYISVQLLACTLCRVCVFVSLFKYFLSQKSKLGVGIKL